MPKSKQPTVSYAAAADSNKKVKPSPPSGVQGVASSSQESGLHNRTKQVKSVFQPQSLAMDVQDSTSKSTSEPVVMPSLKLYETIERFKQITNQTRQQVVHEFMNNFVDENKNGNVVSVFKTPDSADLGRLRSGTFNRTQNGQQKKLTKRHIISGTGRVAYGRRLDPHSAAVSNEEDFEVRVIYRLNKSDNSNHQTSAQQHMDWQDINFGGAEDVPVIAEASFASSAAASVDFALSERVVQSMVLDPPVEFGSDKTDPSSSPVTVNGSSSSSSSSATNKNNSSTNSRINSNISSGGVKASGVKTGSSFGNTTGKSFPNTKAPAFQQQQQPSQLHSVGVGVTGLAAARAKMSSLGQDWADEEELPGFSLPKSGTNSLKAGGGVSREVNKEVNKEVQRQQKLKSAKRG